MGGLLIVGAGGHGKVVAEAAMEMGAWDRIAFLHGGGDGPERILGCPVLGTLEEAKTWQAEYGDLIVAIGDNQRRMKVLQEARGMGFHIPTVVHPRAAVSRWASIGAGAVVLAQAAVNPEARIGEGCIINTGATVDHDCRLAEGVHLSPGVHLGGGVHIGPGSWLGVGTSVIHQVRIGCGVIAGAGSVIIGDVADRVLVAGVPAEVKKVLGDSLTE